MKRKKPEEVLTTRVANLMVMEYHKIPFRFDIGADIKMSPWQASRLHKLHGRWSKGHPDFKLYSCRGGYGGLFIELKATKTLEDTEHTRRQAWYHGKLRKQGYKVTFACGYTEARDAIRSYMKLKRNKNG